MSHFTVMVIGDNPENKLAPFNESLEVEFIDKSNEYKTQYNTELAKEFFCASNSSWGYPLSKDIFDKINNSNIGSITKVQVEDKGFSYLKNKCRYRGYFTNNKGEKVNQEIWFEVYNITHTAHPDKDVCFTGEVLIKKIDPPKEIPLKDMYPDYNTYLSDWHGIDNKSKQGYWHNPKSKWDWYSLGGRWAGMIKLHNGTKVDKAKIKDIANLNELKTFAVLKDGQWYEKGEMGWFGISSNDKEERDWHNEISKLIEGLPEDTLISIYDCHI